VAYGEVVNQIDDHTAGQWRAAKSNKRHLTPQQMGDCRTNPITITVVPTPGANHRGNRVSELQLDLERVRRHPLDQ